MTEKIKGIVLNLRKYNDRNIIVTLYTREKGKLTFISPLGSGKAANARRARLQPLAIIETELNYKPAAELQRLGSITSSEIFSDLYFNSAKRAVTLFISEFLYKLLNATMPDTGLFDFLVHSFLLFDKMESEIANFHIPFLVSLLSFSGIQPDISGFREGYLFEFSSGSFVPQTEAHGPCLEGEEARAVLFIARLNFSNMKCLRLNSVNRRQILYGILNYFSYHFPGLGSMKSPEILKEIFQ